MKLAVVRKIASSGAFSVNNNQGYTRLINPYHDLECVGDREYNEKVYFTDKNEEVDIPNLSGKPAYVVFAPGAHKPAPPKKTFFQRLFW